MMLNVGQKGAKRSAKCCFMRNEKHKYPLQLYKQNLLEP